MKFYKNLYIGDTVKKPGKIKRKLKHHKFMTSIYVIIYVRETKRLEIHNSFFLQQWYYKEHPLYIIGIASGKEEAFLLVGQMTEDALQATGGTDLTKFLFRENRQQMK